MPQRDGLGLTIAKRREHLNMSQEALAYDAGLSTKTIQRIENGSETKTEHVLPLCAALDISPNELFEYEEDPLAGLEPELIEALQMYAKRGRRMNPVNQKKLAAKIKLEVELMK